MRVGTACVFACCEVWPAQKLVGLVLDRKCKHWVGRGVCAQVLLGLAHVWVCLLKRMGCAMCRGSAAIGLCKVVLVRKYCQAVPCLLS